MKQSDEGPSDEFVDAALGCLGVLAFVAAASLLVAVIVWAWGMVL